MIAMNEALAFQTKIGRAAIEQRSRALTTQLMDGLAKIPGITNWTSPVAERRVAVVSFVPGTLNPGKLADALYTKDKVGITTRGGQDRGGIRVSPHFYNLPGEVDRLLAGIAKYMKSGV
jgi:selenocysteine lyase/cysteine desulfurase